MDISTYSFSDVSLVMSHPNVGKITITGEGVGSITIARSQEMTQHDTSADGSVMVSKIITHNGSMAIAVQQTSAAHKWLKKWAEYLIVADTDQWATTSAVLKNPALGETLELTGISPAKRPDATFQVSGQQVQWNFYVARIAG